MSTKIILIVLVLAALGFGFLGLWQVPENTLMVSDGNPPKIYEPGFHWSLPGSRPSTTFSIAPVTFEFPDPNGTYKLFDAEDRDLDTVFSVRYAIEKAGAADLYKHFGNSLEDSLRARLRTLARPAAARLPDNSPNSLNALRQRLEAQLRVPGLNLSLGVATNSDSGSERTRVLLVGIDAGDWLNIDPLFEAGKLPNLKRLVESGVRADLNSLRPMLSPLLWTTMATGTTPDRHGILDFLAPDPNTGDMVPVTRRMRREPAFWNYATQAGRTQGIVGWLATWPAETISGHMVTDRFGYLAFATSTSGSEEGMTWPPDYVDEARPLESNLEDFPSSFWKRFAKVPDSELRALTQEGFKSGDRLGNLALTLATAETYTRIALDLQTKDPDLLVVYYEMVDAVGHLVMPFSPPLRESVDPVAYEQYSSCADESYVFQDELLGRLLEKQDPNTIVMLVSDHGFKSEHERPLGSAEIRGGEAARWHRSPGIFCVQGPGIRRGVVLDNPLELVDIAPTLLALMGLPVPATMEGRVVEEILTDEGAKRFKPNHVDRIDLRPEVWTAPAATQLSGAAKAMQHNNLGLVLEAEGNLEGAEREFRAAVQASPKDRLARTNLGGVMVKTGRYEEAESLLSATIRDYPDNIPTMFNYALLRQKTNRFQEAADLYRKVLARDPAHLDARLNLGHSLVRMGRNDEAEGLFREVLRQRPSDANATFGLGIAAAQKQDLPGAAAAFRKTLELDPNHESARRNLTAVEQAMGN